MSETVDRVVSAVCSTVAAFGWVYGVLSAMNTACNPEKPTAWSGMLFLLCISGTWALGLLFGRTLKK